MRRLRGSTESQALHRAIVQWATDLETHSDRGGMSLITGCARYGSQATEKLGLQAVQDDDWHIVAT